MNHSNFSISSDGLAYKHAFNFNSYNWLSRNSQIWENILTQTNVLRNSHCPAYLEVGVFEGRTFFWLLDNFMPDTFSAVAIDDFSYLTVRQTFLENLELAKYKSRVRLLEGKSEVHLRQLPLESFDLIYVDSAHTAKHVLIDAVLSWNLLRVGGVLIFDDYNYSDEPLMAQFRPKIALDSFLDCLALEVEILHKDYQLIVRKTANFSCAQYYRSE